MSKEIVYFASPLAEKLQNFLDNGVYIMLCYLHDETYIKKTEYPSNNFARTSLEKGI
jgi:hypothetical protein